MHLYYKSDLPSIVIQQLQLLYIKINTLAVTFSLNTCTVQKIKIFTILFIELEILTSYIHFYIDTHPCLAHLVVKYKGLEIVFITCYIIDMHKQVRLIQTILKLLV